MSALVILPTYNEVRNLPLLAERLEAARRTGPSDGRFSAWIVDDSSPDGTAALGRRIARKHRWISVLRRPRREGLARAYLDSFRRALRRGFRIILTLDADGSHPVEKIPALLSAVRRGADLAIGSRYVPGGRTIGWPWRRRMVSRLGCAYVRGWLGLPVQDATSGFVAYRSDRLRELLEEPPVCRGFGYTVELKYAAWRKGYRLKEIPIDFTERAAGASKMSAAIFAEAFLRVLRLGLA